MSECKPNPQSRGHCNARVLLPRHSRILRRFVTLSGYPFLKGLLSKEVVVPVTGSLDRNMAENLHPLTVTDSELRGNGGSIREDGVYVGDETDFSDLVYFWNLRASGIGLVFVPRNHLQRVEEFVKVYLERLDQRPRRNPNLEDWIVLYHRIKDDAELTKIVESFPTSKSMMRSRCSQILWNGLNVRPSTFYFEWDQASATVDKPHDRYVVSVNLPEKRFFADTERDIDGQYLAVEISSYGGEYPDHTLKVPYIRELNEFYSREISVDPWTVSTFDHFEPSKVISIRIRSGRINLNFVLASFNEGAV